MSRILVVEDSPTQAMQLQLVLEDNDFEVTLAEDAETALRLFAPGRFDLILSDIMLPGLSGYDLCQKIKTLRQGRDVPFILLSTLSDAMDIVRGLECGADNFVTKPYEPDQLIARMRTVLANRRLRHTGKVQLGIEVVFLGKRISITSEKEQILDLLMATFEDTVRANRGLQESKAELAAAKADLERHAGELQLRVAERTRDLQERQRQLSRAQAIAHLGDWRFRVSDGRLNWSEEMYRIFGMEPTERQPDLAAVLDMIEFDDRMRMRQFMERAVAIGAPFNTELRIRRHDGAVRDCWIESHSERDEAGRVIALVGVCQDVTERKQAERAARESNERYRQLVESSPDAVLVLQDGVIGFANSAAGVLLGAADQPDLLSGRRLLDFVHEDHRAAVQDRLQELDGPVSASPLDAQLLRPDGTSVEVMLTWSAFQQHDRRAIQVIARDVSASRSMQRQLHQAQKMEAVGQLTGGLAHDFNNLLTIIIGNLDILLDHLEQAPEQRALAEAVLAASLRGADLTRQLLAFSRRQQLQPRPINVNDTVAGLMTLLRRTLGEKIQIEVRTNPDAWIVDADPAQLESALANLAINARDAMPGGGMLIIETANRHLDEAYAAQNVDVQPGDYVVLAVTDTGSGIPAHILPRVFEPFFTTKEVGKGTGLGLSMIYGFARQSGGHVKIYSEEGHGTTVRLYLPRTRDRASATVQAERADPAVRGGGELILVVEDNAEVRTTVVRHLLDYGYRVLEAENGVEGLAVLEANPEIDLLFTDVVMPGGVSGRDLAIEARRRHPSLKVLLTSGFTEATLKEANGKGVLQDAPLLSKPYRKQELAQKVREVLSGG